MSRRPFALVLLVLLAFAARSAAAAVPRSVTMNFKGAEIEAVVQFISELTGKNFILDEKVRGKVTVISPGKITPDEAYEVFQAILHVKGFTIVPAANNVYKIVATREAKQTNIETVEGEVAPGDRFVTRILPLKHVAAETVARILSPLVSKDSAIVAYAPTNTLIITDAYSDITRLAEIIQALKAIAENLSQLSAFSFLDERLPLIDVSINDMLDYASKFAEIIDAAASGGSESLQQMIVNLETQIEQLFDLDPSVLTVSLDDGGIPSTALTTSGGVNGSSPSTTTINPDGDNNGFTLTSSLANAGDLNGTNILIVGSNAITDDSATATSTAGTKTRVNRSVNCCVGDF